MDMYFQSMTQVKGSKSEENGNPKEEESEEEEEELKVNYRSFVCWHQKGIGEKMEVEKEKQSSQVYSQEIRLTGLGTEKSREEKITGWHVGALWP